MKTRKWYPIMLAFSLVLLFASCCKEPGNDNGTSNTGNTDGGGNTPGGSSNNDKVEIAIGCSWGGGDLLDYVTPVLEIQKPNTSSAETLDQNNPHFKIHSYFTGDDTIYAYGYNDTLTYNQIPMEFFASVRYIRKSDTPVRESVSFYHSAGCRAIFIQHNNHIVIDNSIIIDMSEVTTTLNNSEDINAYIDNLVQHPDTLWCVIDEDATATYPLD